MYLHNTFLTSSPDWELWRFLRWKALACHVLQVSRYVGLNRLYFLLQSLQYS